MTETQAGAPRQVHVVVVAHDDRRWLPGCLDALARSTCPARVTVVDSASRDGSAAYVAASHPEVELVALEENLGYAGGANAGLRAGTPPGEEPPEPYALVMNADVVLEPDHLEVLVAALEADPRVGAAQGRLYRMAPEDFPGRTGEPGPRLDSAGHRIRRSRMVVDRGQGHVDGPEYDVPASVFSACGAALFLRRDLLRELAPDGRYFDPAFFAYKEDIDLCWRARLLGWDVRYVPEAVGHHVRAWSGDGPPPRSRIGAAARRHSWKNHYLLMIRNDAWSDVLRGLPWILGWELLRWGHALFRDPALLGAYPMLGRALPGALRARRHIQSGRRVDRREMRRWFGGAERPLGPRREGADGP